MKTERELFLYELEGRGYEFENKTWIHGMGDGGGLFDDDQLNMVWEMWCASASREGYKLVPVEINDEIESAMFSSVARGEMPCDIYKSMIEAQESGND